MSCTCKVGPGKFEGEDATTFMAWQQAMLGNSDISTGAEGEMVDWLRHPLNLDADASVVKDALAYGYCQECIDEAGQDVHGGIAVWEDSQGFVYSRTFETREAFDAALAEAEAEDAEATEDETLYHACPRCGERESVDDPHDHSVQDENAVAEDEDAE